MAVEKAGVGQKGPRSPLEPNRVGSLIGLGERMEKRPCEYLSGEEETAVARALPSESGWPQGVVRSHLGSPSNEGSLCGWQNSPIHLCSRLLLP